MSEAKHTPGPLFVRVSGEWPFYINIVDVSGEVVFRHDLPCYSTSHKTFAQAFECKGFSDGLINEGRVANRRALADAHLRAAAPELLEALEAIVESVDAGTCAMLAHLQLSAKAAIAKATGSREATK